MITRSTFCFILSVGFVFGGKECIFDLSTMPSSIIMQKYGSDHLLLTANTSFLINEENSLYAVCSAGYSTPRQDPYGNYYAGQDGNTEHKEISISCKNEAITYQAEDGRALQLLNLVCPNNDGRYYRESVEFCDYDGLVYGFSIKNVSIILAEVCFDSSRMETKFIHYVSGFSSPILEKQNLIRPDVDLRKIIKKVIFPPKAIMKKDLNNMLDFGKIEEFRNVLNFTMDSLVPTNLITTHYSNLSNFKSVNTIPWWSSLKYGNWKLLERLIMKKGKKNNINVYTGTSVKLNALSYNDGVYERNIPFYVWSLIRQENVTDIVVIGINSPFFSTTDNDVLFCKDICDEIDWMSPLWFTRKMPALGYIFCCDPSDIVDKLDGFPNIGKPRSERSISYFSLRDILVPQ